MKPEQITAWALDEASAEERQQLEAALLENPQDKQKADETKAFCDFLLSELRDDSLALTDQQRERLVAQASGVPEASGTLALQAGEQASRLRSNNSPRTPQTKWRIGIIVRLAVAACVALGGFWTWQSSLQKQREGRASAAVVVAEKPAVKVQMAQKPEAKKKAGQGPEARLLAATPVKPAIVPGQHAGKPPAPGPLGDGDAMKLKAPSQRQQESAAQLKKLMTEAQKLQNLALDPNISTDLRKKYLAQLDDMAKAARALIPEMQEMSEKAAQAGALALNKEQRVMTAGDVEKLKRIQDQNAYALNFGDKVAAPVAEMPVVPAQKAEQGAVAVVPAAAGGSGLLAGTGDMMPLGTGAVTLNGGSAVTVGGAVSGSAGGKLTMTPDATALLKQPQERPAASLSLKAGDRTYSAFGRGVYIFSASSLSYDHYGSLSNTISTASWANTYFSKLGFARGLLPGVQQLADASAYAWMSTAPLELISEPEEAELYASMAEFQPSVDIGRIGWTHFGDISHVLRAAQASTDSILPQAGAPLTMKAILQRHLRPFRNSLIFSSGEENSYIARLTGSEFNGWPEPDIYMNANSAGLIYFATAANLQLKASRDSGSFLAEDQQLLGGLLAEEQMLSWHLAIGDDVAGVNGTQAAVFNNGAEVTRSSGIVGTGGVTFGGVIAPAEMKAIEVRGDLPMAGGANIAAGSGALVINGNVAAASTPAAMGTSSLTGEVVMISGQPYAVVAPAKPQAITLTGATTISNSDEATPAIRNIAGIRGYMGAARAVVGDGTTVATSVVSGTDSLTVGQAVTATPLSRNAGATVSFGSVAAGTRLTKADTGAVVLGTGTNVYTGGTTVNGGVTVDSGATLHGGNNVTADSNTLGATASAPSAGATFAITTAAVAGNTGAGDSLTKSGAGTLTLAGGTTYTGTTTISGGTLTLAADSEQRSNSGITAGGKKVDAGALALAAGTNDLNGTVLVTAATPQPAAGASSVIGGWAANGQEFATFTNTNEPVVVQSGAATFGATITAVPVPAGMTAPPAAPAPAGGSAAFFDDLRKRAASLRAAQSTSPGAPPTLNGAAPSTAVAGRSVTVYDYDRGKSVPADSVSASGQPALQQMLRSDRNLNGIPAAPPALAGVAGSTAVGTGGLTLAATTAAPMPQQPQATISAGASTLTLAGGGVIVAGAPLVQNPQPTITINGGTVVTRQVGANVTTVTTTTATPPVSLVVTTDADTRYFDAVSGDASSSNQVSKDMAKKLEVTAFRKSDTSGESYTRIIENEMKEVAREPLSTLSIDVDTASYANVRRFLNQNMIPPPDAVRIEELVNYFPTAEEGPAHEAKEPFAVRVELAPCPWQPVHRLARISIKGREMDKDRKASNLVFLVDVSGSMNEPAKLPLVQQSLRMLTSQLGEGDRVTMVVYAGSSGVVLPPTNGEKKAEILAAIDRLSAGGSTHGSAGLKLAYEQAVAGFIKGGVNRVILCTDGDFNVGVSSPEELEKLIKHKAKTGVFLSVLGFGSGNLQDRTMETLADKGNGNYAYIDSLSEARKVLVEQMGSTLDTIAKDVKIQVEFNPAAVRSYRLIGYENRLLAKEDFNDDTKDAGEIGAGHSVVALYEIVPTNLPPGADGRPAVDALKYQAPAITPAQLAEAAKSGETMTVKLRYKAPDSDLSKLIEVPTKDAGKTLTASTEEFKFSAAVAGFGLLLRDSNYKGTLSWETVRRLALDGKGADKLGYRGEFLQLIDKARGLKETR